jgi:hypothetical protein
MNSQLVHLKKIHAQRRIVVTLPLTMLTMLTKSLCTTFLRRMNAAFTTLAQSSDGHHRLTRRRTAAKAAKENRI